ncbi:ras guanine nucleotide exchange factor domain-containing protein [Syncephalastrum racemosum]|uniref:Ras guanine nucleotide exchange factor domain-containing protein n=1 Tax=Syncephalastrum racemosum TaxID=13706 RepID=A0A1X2HA66_SYNRA|nr:ras guanine nucleotide exchange factor domain-containing protein [Syncephalastrum racemosum]
MLLAVRNFVAVCQTIPVPLQSPMPVFDGQVSRSSITSIPEESYAAHGREHRENSTASESTHGSTRTSVTGTTSVTSQRDSFNMDAVFDAAKMFVGELEASVEAMATSLKENATLSGQALAAVLFSRMDHLTQRTGQMMVAFEKVCSDEAGQRTLAHSKEALLNGFGTLFCKLQMLTGTSAISEATLTDLEQVIQRILVPVQAMKGCIVALDENMMKDEASDGEDEDEEDEAESGVSPYLRHDYRKRDIAFGADGQVRGGTLSALVERLTMHDQSDTNFTTTFMLTFRSFCSPIKLLKLLEDRFSLSPPKDLTEEELEAWTEKKQIPVRLRVFNIFKLWLEQYFSTEDDMFILDRLLDFNSVMIRSNLSTACGDQLERLVKRRREAEGPMQLKRRIASARVASEAILPSNTKKFRLLDIHPLELARQLTLMDFSLYSMIQATDCMNKAWSESDNRIRANISFNTQITLWVMDAILCPSDVKKRAQVVKYWIDVAQKCQHLHNFNTLMAILSAFESSAIGRLGRTWEAAGTKSQQALGVLRKLLGTDRNYAEYRTLIHSINPPCIPFLGVYLQDLTFIADGNPDMLVTPRRSTSLINFGKLSKTGAVIRDMQQFQSLSYAFQPVELLQTFIKANLQSARDEEVLYTASVKLEPKEREDQKVTRMLSESGFV